MSIGSAPPTGTPIRRESSRRPAGNLPVCVAVVLFWVGLLVYVVFQYPLLLGLRKLMFQ